MAQKLNSPIPRGALDMGVIVLGKTRSGKSSTCRALVETLADEKARYVILTPKDDWWGLKLGADGKSPGKSVVIFGGEYADLPINEHAGKQIGELIATGNRPSILTLSELSMAKRARFFIDFAEALFKLNRGRLYVVIDECHNFAPKGKMFDPLQAEMLHWANRLASEGLGRGITLISASQRPQKVHNDYLSSHETLIAKKVIVKADRAADQDWIDGCGDPAVGKELIDTVADLSRAEAWVWCPEVKFGPKRVEFPFYTTYDSFKVQPPGRKKLKGWAAVDLDDVKAKLGAVVEAATANDPAKLRAEIARLQTALKKAEGAVPAKVSDKERELLLRQGFDEGWEARGQAALEALQQASQRLETAVRASKQPGRRSIAVAPPKRAALPSGQKIARVAQRSEPAAHNGLVGGSNPPARSISNGKLPKAERSILEVLAAMPDHAGSKRKIAATAGYAHKGGSFNNALSALNTAGLLTRSGDNCILTKEGLEAVGGPKPMPTGAELFDLWMVHSALGKAERSILTALVKEVEDPYGNGVTKEWIANHTNYEAKGGSFNNALSKLNTLGLIERNADMVRAIPAFCE